MTPRKRLEIALRGEIPKDPAYFSSPINANQCDGCGKIFDYPIHDHYDYRSCSIECDKIIEEYVNSEEG